jgi:hypothetical protein
MIDVFLKFAGWVKSLVFWGSSPHESNFFSKSFNFRKWLIFISLIALIFLSMFLIFKLFVISAKYLDLKNRYAADQNVVNKKELVLDGEFKTLHLATAADTADSKVLKKIYGILRSNSTYDKQTRVLFLGVDALLNENATLLKQNRELANIHKKTE